MAGPRTPGKSACPSPLGNLLACPLPAATLLKSADLCFSVWSAPNSVFLICLLSSPHSQPMSTPRGGGGSGSASLGLLWPQPLNGAWHMEGLQRQ